MRFAADAIFGNSLVSVQNGELNGIIRQCKDDFISKLEGEEELQKMLIQKTASAANLMDDIHFTPFVSATTMSVVPPPISIVTILVTSDLVLWIKFSNVSTMLP